MPGLPRTGDLYEEHGRLLWGLAYRMTGNAADADDIVQDTFARALATPPARADEPWRPWLVRVAMNLGRDVLRRRKHEGYVGPWLPSPVADLTQHDASPEPRTAERSYDLREAASFAFLLALEALTPQQRAVLILCDVFDYSIRETAEALLLSEGNVKVVRHRAKKRMQAYDRARTRDPAPVEARSLLSLQRFLSAIAQDDVAAVEACLAEGARVLSDGGGEFVAALRPVTGKSRVARFLLGVQRKQGSEGSFELRSVNGAPAIVFVRHAAASRIAKRFVVRIELDDTNLIREVHIVMATKKLTHVDVG